MQFGLQSTLVKKISRRYALALFGTSVSKKTLTEVHEDVVFLAETIKSSAELRDFLIDPHHSIELTRSVVTELFKKRVHHSTFDFLMFLIEKGRLSILSEILVMFIELYQQENKIGNVQIISASELTKQQLNAILKKLSLRWEKEFLAETRVDPSLIGGFQIKNGDQVLDYSMKNQLENFRRQIINA